MYLTRNSNGCLFLHEQLPHRVTLNGKGFWESKGAKMPINETKKKITRNCYLPITWEDEPMQVEISQIDIPHYFYT